MTKIEQYQQEREAVLAQMRELHQQLIGKDLAFWKKNAQELFTQFPILETLSWGQGFFYNDEHYAFETTDFAVNGLEMKYEHYRFRPEEERPYRNFEPSKLYLIHSENDKEAYEEFYNQYYKQRDEQEIAFIKEMQTKYAPLLEPAVAFAQLLNGVETHLGSRHFADVFGKKAKIVCSREGLTIEDYDDRDASWSGVLDELL